MSLSASNAHAPLALTHALARSQWRSLTEGVLGTSGVEIEKQIPQLQKSRPRLSPEKPRRLMRGKTLQEFMDKMKDPSASGLLSSMKDFAHDLTKENSRSVDEMSEAVQKFFQSMEEVLFEHPLWKGCEPEELERSCDGVEKFVMMRLHDKTFAVEPDEVAEDDRLSERMQVLRFLDADHLGISKSFQEHAPWMSAQKELGKICSYKTPRDKLVAARLVVAPILSSSGALGVHSSECCTLQVCILNCCKRINSSLSQTTAGT